MTQLHDFPDVSLSELFKLADAFGLPEGMSSRLLSDWYSGTDHWALSTFSRTSKTVPDSTMFNLDASEMVTSHPHTSKSMVTTRCGTTSGDNSIQGKVVVVASFSICYIFQ